MYQKWRCKDSVAGGHGFDVTLEGFVNAGGSLLLQAGFTLTVIAWTARSRSVNERPCADAQSLASYRRA
jgi:hypothetical protein